MKIARCLVLILFCVRFAGAADDRDSLEREQKVLAEQSAKIRASATADQFADADVFLKGITWALRYETNLAPGDLTLIKRALGRGHNRLDALVAKQPVWTKKQGPVLRGY